MDQHTSGRPSALATSVAEYGPSPTTSAATFARPQLRVQPPRRVRVADRNADRLLASCAREEGVGSCRGPWSSNYDSCKAAYRQLHGSALHCGDSAEAEHCRLFLNVLIELNSWVLDRHHVLHAIWEQDPALEPGMTLALRRRGRRVSGAWPVDRLDALNRYLEDAHHAVMAEMARLLNRQDQKRASGPER